MHARRLTRLFDSQPHILVLFSISYGLDRKQIEDWNCRLQKGDSPTFVPYKSRASVSASFSLAISLTNLVVTPLLLFLVR